ncbi:MAG: mannonate dehydratase [Anaerolineales bacterium]
MRFGMVLPNLEESTLKLARQIGVSDIVTSLGDHEGGGTGVWDFQKVLVQFRKIADAGLFWSVIEGMPVTDRVKLGLPGRDQDIENWQKSLRVVGAVGIPIVCYNWMAAFGWLRTSFTTRVRGDALATSYNHEQMQRGPLSDYGVVPEEQLWDALEYFLKAVVPVAEEAGVQLAMHPDDPPLSPIRGMGRIMTSPEAFQRMIDLVPSPANGLTFCQGCFAEMGVDVCASIRHFGQQGKLFFAHFRNLRGRAADFTEAFHDDGDTDMYAAMRAYYDVGFAGPMRPDHGPTLEGDTNARPGYSLWGRLYAIGYMRGLAEAVEKSR